MSEAVSLVRTAADDRRGLSHGRTRGISVAARQSIWRRVRLVERGRRAGCARALEALAYLDAELGRKQGPYFDGDTVTALDLYSATAMNALVPLSDADCPIAPPFRAAFTWMGRTLGAAVTPALLAHRDRVVARFIELPIAL